jgi:hypothetical protein
MPANCTLCNSTKIETYILNLRGKNYFICKNCNLIFMDPDQHLNFGEQKIRYNFHQNSIQDIGYVKFLNSCIQPTIPFLEKYLEFNHEIGLDYGSGPEPTLFRILEKYGYKMENFDPIYNDFVLDKTYSYIFSTEVWEHFSNPFLEISKIKNLLKRNGILSIMTSTWNEDIDFKTWHYSNDDTHVSFYHKKSMEWIVEFFQWKVLKNPASNVWIFQNCN